MIGNAGSHVTITGLGAYAPERVIANDELAQMVDTSDEWIIERTGIRERRIAADEQALSDLAMPATVPERACRSKSAAQSRWESAKESRP